MRRACLTRLRVQMSGTNLACFLGSTHFRHLYTNISRLNFFVLSNASVRFSQRSVFPDEHELQPGYAIFGAQDEIWRYTISIGFRLERDGVPAAIVVAGMAESPTAQRLGIQTVLNNTEAIDEVGVFCVAEAANSEQMWTEYAKCCEKCRTSEVASRRRARRPAGAGVFDDIPSLSQRFKAERIHAELCDRQGERLPSCPWLLPILAGGARDQALRSEAHGSERGPRMRRIKGGKHVQRRYREQGWPPLASVCKALGLAGSVHRREISNFSGWAASPAGGPERLPSAS